MTFCALLLMLFARVHLCGSYTQATFLHLHLHTVKSAKIEIIPKFIISGKHFPKSENKIIKHVQVVGKKRFYFVTKVTEQ